MGAIRINTNNGGATGSTLITIDPGTVYTIANASDDEVSISAIDSAGATQTIKLDYTDSGSGAFWKDEMERGRDFYNSFFGVNVIEILANEALERALSLALQGDEVAVFSMNAAVVTLAGKASANKCSDDANNCAAELTQQIDEAKNAAANAGFSTFRLPEGGGIVSISISNDEVESYTKSICGDERSCKLDVIEYRPMSIFKEVTIS